MNTKIKLWIRKRWKDMLFLLVIGLLFIPQIRQPIQVYVQRVFAGSPEEITDDQQKKISSLNWALQDLKGKAHNMVNSKGKVILVNSWATWCPPCIAEMPSLQSLYNDYKEKVDFYFISNEKQNVLKQWMNESEYNFPVYQTMGPIPEGLNSSSLPTTYVINKQGKIVIEEVGAHDWNSESLRSKLDAMIDS